jgi:hypothetical protein
MRVGITAALVVCAVMAATFPAYGQAPREDAIWARTTDGAPITLDGMLDEPAWALAESVVIKYAYDTGIPGSGFQGEGGFFPTDTLHATIKLLVNGNQMYMGATVRDSSIGGSVNFNIFDGFLMAIKDHTILDRPAPPAEYFYSWWFPESETPSEVGKEPGFVGKFGVFPPDTLRDPNDVDMWDAVTIVDGISNSDTLFDKGYVTEMRFDLSGVGYDVTDADGDIIEWNISIYDADWHWPNTQQPIRVSSNRTWWQGPWGISADYNEVRVYSRPDVTVNSGPAPNLEPELRIPSAGSEPAPVIDGLLTDSVWDLAPSFDIRYGDQALRDSYPGVQAYRSGQWQPDVNGGQAFVLDPGDATIKYFYKDNTLYLGFDVRDRAVQYIADFERWDGFLVSINDRDTLTRDNNLEIRRLTFQVNQDGTALAHDYLPFLADTLFGAEYALSLKGGTTVDTLGAVADSGYTAELSVDLTKLGYPAGLGDRSIFLGIDMLDGDSFTPFTFSYATRTWWMREYQGSCCPVWGYLDPLLVVDVGEGTAPARNGYALLGSYPNPFQNDTVIRYRLAAPSVVTLDVYDVKGRLVATKALGMQEGGLQQLSFAREGLGSGIYMYRLKMADQVDGPSKATLFGKVVILK